MAYKYLTKQASTSLLLLTTAFAEQRNRNRLGREALAVLDDLRLRGASPAEVNVATPNFYGVNRQGGLQLHDKYKLKPFRIGQKAALAPIKLIAKLLTRRG